MNWQVQEAKQRFSEVLRAVKSHGPQTISRHGEEIAVIMDVSGYRRLTQPDMSFADQLRSFPKLDPSSQGPDVFDEIETDRQRDVRRNVDLEADE